MNPARGMLQEFDVNVGVLYQEILWLETWPSSQSQENTHDSSKPPKDSDSEGICLLDTIRKTVKGMPELWLVSLHQSLDALIVPKNVGHLRHRGI